MIDAGDLVFDCGDAEDLTQRLEAAADAILNSGKTLLGLGGEHFITLPLLRAYGKKYGEMALIHFDAHTDTYNQGSRYDHGTMFYKAVKDGLIDPKRSVQVGIRTENPDTLGFNIIDAREVHETGPVAVAQKIRNILSDHPTYLTFDIDGLDPAFAPGTGTPVWGGLTSGQASIILRDIAGINLVGGDVVEVSPPFDTTGATAVAGAHIALELICLWGWTRR